jgi:hypothetical protein
MTSFNLNATCALAVFLLLAGRVTGHAQTPPSTNPVTQALAAAPENDTAWGGTSTLNGQFSGGTQQQNSISLFSTMFVERGRTPEQLLINARARFEVGYGNAKKPEHDRITTTEMIYGETRVAANARQLVSAFGGSTPLRTDNTAHTWIYGIAAWYHHIAFDVDLQQAYGVGVSHDNLGGIAHLAIAADLRHVQQHFGSQPDFSSWAVRVNQSYLYNWKVGKPGASRDFSFSETIEGTPMLASADATQARSLIKFGLPVTAALSVPISLSADYLGNASAGFKRIYWKTTVGVEWTFGPK